MPQMAPLMWMYLYFFFLSSLILILILNYFIKPFEMMPSLSFHKTSTQKPWKL